MLDRGFLASTVFYASYAHQNEHIERYLVAVNNVFKEISEAINKDTVSSLLKGPVCHEGFKRLN